MLHVKSTILITYGCHDINNNFYLLFIIFLVIIGQVLGSELTDLYPPIPSAVAAGRQRNRQADTIDVQLME
mgnify:CR=1 FL=1